MRLIPARNKKGHFNIYKEDEFLGRVPQKLVPAESFLCLDNFCSDEFESVVKKWVFNNAQNRLLNYLAKAERTIFDCKNYLRRWGIPEAVMMTAINEAKNKKWVCDERYAEMYVQDCLLTGKSPTEAKYALLQKEIFPEIVNDVIDKVFSKETKNDLLDNLIEKLLPRYAELKPEKQFEKIATTLYRKGFEYGEYESRLREKIKSIAFGDG